MIVRITDETRCTVAATWTETTIVDEEVPCGCVSFGIKRRVVETGTELVVPSKQCIII